MISIQLKKKAFTILFSCILLQGQGQQVPPLYSLAVSDQETSNLIFPYRIIKTDLGSGELLGHQDPAVDHVLFVKARVKSLTPTNLSVYTADGKSYFFSVRYEAVPDTLVLCFAQAAQHPEVMDRPWNDAQLDTAAARVETLPRTIHRSAQNEQITLAMKGIYTKNQTIWMTLSVRNGSPIPYSPAEWQFAIVQKHRPKRTAEQQKNIVPLWQSPLSPVAAGVESSWVFGFSLFTVPADRVLAIQLREAEGQRSVRISVSRRLLAKAKHF